jgi:CelD/BcsL family acetyltransferase involved in cellulose biosynthesis
MTTTGAVWHANVIGEATQLAQLAPAWDRLWAESVQQRPSIALRHGYVSLGVRHAAPGSRFCIILVWQAERLVGAWPLAIRRERGIRVAHHVGCGNDEEYAGPLVADDVDPARVVALALPHLRAVADAVWLCNLACGSALEAAFADAGLFRACQPVVSPIVRSGQFADPAAWRASKSKHFRALMGNDRRRLAKQGRLESIRVEPDAAAAFCDWFFATKCRWLDTNGLKSKWLRQSHCRDFFEAALRDPAGSGVFAPALRLDGAYVAGGFCFDGDPIEFFATTYDPAHGRFGPGSLLYEDIAVLGIATGRNVDLRITWDTYKLRWADGGDARLTMLMALTPRGVPAALAFAARQRWKAVRRRLGALKRRWWR